ncbi:hypothetical protein MES5069_400115 [Mesorhizobium escarrei]|uniref:Uncharacterized protein n=1 Tax=Mesorhizobium escarrei TaxID=666018 RepID=A0ABN8K1F4_9HYPH|nr:hypothetical protein MES5069_400115 [Mesorhizobium escarrei]
MKARLKKVENRSIDADSGWNQASRGSPEFVFEIEIKSANLLRIGETVLGYAQKKLR